MTSALARKYGLQVAAYNSATALAAVTGWTPFKGITDFNNQISPTIQSAADYDTNGWDSSEKTMQTWSVTVKARRPLVASSYDAGQEIVRAARVQFGDQARVWLRYFDNQGNTDAWAGAAIPNWTQGKTGVADIEEVQVAFSGDGVLTNIANPYVTALSPVITGVSPTGAAVGTSVAITGTAFTGTVSTTGVKFGGTNATSFSVINDGLIVAVVPAGSAGSTTVTVTNANGTSPSFTYTRGA